MYIFIYHHVHSYYVNIYLVTIILRTIVLIVCLFAAQNIGIYNYNKRSFHDDYDISTCNYRHNNNPIYYLFILLSFFILLLLYGLFLDAFSFYVKSQFHFYCILFYSILFCFVLFPFIFYLIKVYFILFY